MKVFVRDINTWESKAVLDAQDWELPVFSSNISATGSVTVIGETDYSGNWAILDGKVYYIDKCDTSTGLTTIILKLPVWAFERDIVYTGNGTEALENFIAGRISAEFINQADTAYAMPYITVTTSGTTNADVGLGMNEVYGFTDVLKLAFEKKIQFFFSPTASSLAVSIRPAIPSARTIFFGDGHNQLISAVLSEKIVSKVTARRITVENELITVDSSETYYWHSDGSVSATEPSPRIPGIWNIVSVEDDDVSLIEAAREAMRDNSSGYKITFDSDEILSLWDKVTLRVNGKAFTAEVTGAEISAGDDRIVYDCGSLPVTLTEKIASANAEKVSESVIYEEREDEYVPSSGGTVTGDVNISGNVSADILVVSENSYGSAVPATGVKGQLFFLIS